MVNDRIQQLKDKASLAVEAHKHKAPPPQSVKKMATYLAVLGGVLLLILTGLHFLVDKDAISKEIYAVIKQETGYNARAENISLSLIPFPVITMENLLVENDTRSAAASLIEVAQVSFKFSFASLFNGVAGGFDEITFYHPSLLLERYTDRGVNWEFIKRFSATKMTKIPASKITIENAEIKISDMILGDDVRYDNLNATLSKGFTGGWSVAGSINVEKALNSFTGKIDIVDKGRADHASFAPDVTWSDANGSINYKGALDIIGGSWVWNGDLRLQTKNIIPWLTQFISKNNQEALADSLTIEQPMDIALKLAGNQKEQQLRDVTLKLNAGTGLGQMSIERAEKPHVRVYWDFEDLDFNKLVPSTNNDSFSGAALELLLRQVLSTNYSADIQLNVKKFNLAKGMVGHVVLAGDMKNNAMNLSRGRLRLPGKTTFGLNGSVVKDAAERVIYDGNVEVSGLKFQDFIKGNGLELLGLVIDKNDAFKMSMKASVAREQTILSNVELQSSGVKISGGLNINNKTDNDVQGTITIAGGQLDRLFTSTVLSARAKDKGAYDVAPIFFPWLAQIGGSYNLNVSLKDNTFGKVKNAQSSLLLRLAKNVLAFSQMNIALGDTSVKGEMKFDQNAIRPKLTAKMDVTSLNFQSEASEKSRMKPVPRGNHQVVWSKTMFDFKEFQGFDAEIDLKVKKIFHNLFELDAVSANISSKDDVWQLKAMQGTVWGGVLQAQGQLSLGTIPAISVAFALQNIPSEKFLDAFMGLNGVEGPMTLTGQIVASGLNLADWVSNNRGSLSISTYNNIIKGFDLPALVKLVPQVSSAEEIQKQAPTQLLTNQSELDTLSGGFALENGVLTSSSSSVKLRTRDAVGGLNASIDLKTWMMNAAFEFKLLTVSRGDYPAVSVLFKDSMDDPEVNLDLRALEAFMARRGGVIQ